MPKTGKVRRIVDEAFENNEWIFLVDWAGYNKQGYSYDHSWEPESSLSGLKIFEKWQASHSETKWMF